MYKIYLFIAFWLLWDGALHAYENVNSVDANTANAPVCFFDFKAESLVGRDENTIVNPIYCLYEIDKTKFLGLLSSKPDSEFYMPAYIRAKITFSPNEVYFIDNRGIVRFGNRKFSIDKDAFTSSLTQVKKAPPLPKWKGKGCSADCGQ